MADTLNNKQIQISALNNIADAYINLKDYKKAIDYGEVALELTSIEKPTKKRAWSLLNQGSANYYLQNYEISKNYLVECVNLAKEKKLIEVEMFAHDFLAKIYEENKDFEASVKEQKQYLEIRNLFLKDKKDASNADLNVEIESQGELIQENNEALEAVNQKSKLFVGLVISLLVVIGFILFYYRKRKKKTASQELKLRAQYLKLENDFNAYKSVNTAAKSIPNSYENMSLKPYKNSSLTPDKRKVYKRDILSYMKSEKPYLNPDMTQSDLANQLGISSHHLSEVLYYGMEQNFYNFINSYRILKAKSLIKSPKYRDAKIISIAYDSGFKSKTTFNRIFKSLTGITPSEYRNEVKNNQ